MYFGRSKKIQVWVCVCKHKSREVIKLQWFQAAYFTLRGAYMTFDGIRCNFYKAFFYYGRNVPNTNSYNNIFDSKFTYVCFRRIQEERNPWITLYIRAYKRKNEKQNEKEFFKRNYLINKLYEAYFTFMNESQEKEDGEKYRHWY